MRTAGLCLLLAALGATLAAGPADALTPSTPPEFGRCVPAPGKTGEWRGSYCTTRAAVPGKGAYEWEPGPGPKKKFEGLGEGVSLETPAGTKIVCAASEWTGEYTGAKTETLKVKLLGCTEAATKTNCQTVPLVEGEITSTELEGELGFIKSGTFPVIGLDMKPKSGSAVFTFSCGKFPEVALADTVEGSVIAPIRPRSRMSPAFKLAYKQAHGVQAVQSFEGGAKDTLSSTFVKGTATGTEAIGFASSREDTNEELLEIKAK